MEQETIAAIATAPGESGIGIVRLSGAQAFSILQTVFRDRRGRARRQFAPRRLYLGYIVDNEGRHLDQVLAVYMPGPYSYTGEDVVEINAHGGALVLKEILLLLLEHGARLAEPGEFTQRAFLNGKMDLVQVEAVIDVINAKSKAALTQAGKHLRGELSQQVESIRGTVLSLLAQAAASIDFPEHDIPELTKEAMLAGLEAALQAIAALLQTSFAGRVLREGLQVAIVGRPNVGKSSLLNALLGRERAIVTDIAGTTRDTIEEYFAIEGIPIQLIDTAGLRQTDDPVEKIGVSLAEKTVESADLVLVVLDQSQPLTEEDRYVLSQTATATRFALLNKCDLPRQLEPADLELLEDITTFEISAKDRIGLQQLQSAIADLVLQGVVQAESAFVANARQEGLLREAARHLESAADTLRLAWPIDMTHVDLQAACDCLGAILGQTASDDLVHEIFGRFCIGK
ncbi:MAG: tRNA uridine-5-carboxymethylaminomethyl(34) synthesis GTPase MnmE [Firmicutes bacterium]|nr:tRNA uridine-5-carboxymethylaminomethyl(34) synthesis GTPase MnmE [Bacillota bacterium]